MAVRVGLPAAVHQAAVLTAAAAAAAVTAKPARDAPAARGRTCRLFLLGVGLPGGRLAAQAAHRQTLLPRAGPRLGCFRCSSCACEVIAGLVLGSQSKVLFGAACAS